MDPYVHSRAGESRRGNGRGKAGKAAVDTVEAAAAPWTNGSGFFRHVLTQYHESNLLYSKMQYIHVLVNQIRGDKYRKRMAREELWRGQNHNAYWHTPNGGIYTSNLRKSVYASLIEAEKVTREKGIFIPSIITVDFDMDGVNEFLFQGQEMNAYVHAVGGAVFELDYLPKPWNYQDTMTRHPEAYHKDGEPHDSYPRNSFVDHFFRSDESVDRFVDLRHEELGDFVHGLYEPETVHKEDHRLVLRRRGTLQQDRVAAPVEIRKTYLFDQAGLRVRYAIVNLGDTKLAGLFAPEINLALPPVEQTMTTFFAVQSDGGEEKLDCSRVALDGGSSVVCRDFVHNLSLRVNAPATERVWTFPIETTFLAGGTLRTEYQATCIVPQWELSLDADDRLEVEITPFNSLPSSPPPPCQGLFGFSDTIARYRTRIAVSPSAGRPLRALRRKRKVLRGLSRGARGGCGCPAGAASRCVQIQDNPIDPRLRLEKVHLTSQNELQKCAAGVAGEVARLAEIEVHPRLHVFR